MKNGFLDRHKPILTALKEAGFQVDGVVEQEKKTVITISPSTEYPKEVHGNGIETQPDA
ncbi:MAG: hypothetical protein FWG29_08270 [Treponema sp.]|nr:hypothetical protein [Treponema sp.]